MALPGTDDSLEREVAVRACSRSLGELLDRDPGARAMLGPGPLPDRAGYLAAMTSALAQGGFASLRLAKRRELLAIADRDVHGELSLEVVGARLSDLADACLQAGLDTLSAPDAMTVIAMGKLGGRELNYSSDIDLIFVAEEDLGASTSAAEALIRELGSPSPEGQAFRLDLELRPEGRSGALVRSLESCLEYYDKWAETWEYQALIKGRFAAGNERVGRSFVEDTRPLVFPKEISTERIAQIRKMKERVEEHASRSARKRQVSDSDDVKLGPGGIRDIEFSVQLLQMVHGGHDASVTSATTLEALPALVEGGYLAEDDGAGLSVAYRWLRTVEHRLQLWQERQVHRLPQSREDRIRLARSMGFHPSPGAAADVRFTQAHRAVLADVRARFEKLFYRPMIEALADTAGPRLSEEALRDRLRVLGFRDAQRAARTLSDLVSGSSRRSKLFRVLTPALLRFLAGTPMPDQGLFAFLHLGEALHGRLDALGALRDNPPALSLLARVLGSGRLLGDLLPQVPEALGTIVDRRGPSPPKGRDRLVREAVASLGWRDADQRLDGLRRFKRRELVGIALADVAGEIDVVQVGVSLTDLAEACLEAALTDVELPLAVIGMGKLGGRELNYASDIDVMFVHDGDQQVAERVAETLVRAIGEVTPEGQAFRIDAALRPEGKSGPLARSVDSYNEYYERWSSPWEHQALTKARFAAGDRSVGERFLDMTSRLAFPAKLGNEALAEIRHLKARMETERIPRGVDPRRHLKLGPGGMSDVEFAVQLVQLERSAQHPSLRVPGTLDALGAARDASLIDEASAARLDEAYRFLSRLRDRLYLLFAKPVDVLPSKPEDLEAAGIAMGYRDQPRQQLEEAYLRTTRRARKVAEVLIYG